jgi:hypothetical protein
MSVAIFSPSISLCYILFMMKNQSSKIVISHCNLDADTILLARHQRGTSEVICLADAPQQAGKN